MFQWEEAEQNRNLSEPEVTLGQVLKSIHPNVKVIVMLRNPKDR